MSKNESVKVTVVVEANGTKGFELEAGKEYVLHSSDKGTAKEKLAALQRYMVSCEMYLTAMSDSDWEEYLSDRDIKPAHAEPKDEVIYLEVTIKAKGSDGFLFKAWKKYQFGGSGQYSAVDKLRAWEAFQLDCEDELSAMTDKDWQELLGKHGRTE